MYELVEVYCDWFRQEEIKNEMGKVHTGDRDSWLSVLVSCTALG
jgi:hypothetical protein